MIQGDPNLPFLSETHFGFYIEKLNMYISRVTGIEMASFNFVHPLCNTVSSKPRQITKLLIKQVAKWGHLN